MSSLISHCIGRRALSCSTSKFLSPPFGVASPSVRHLSSQGMKWSTAVATTVGSAVSTCRQQLVDNNVPEAETSSLHLMAYVLGQKTVSSV